MIVQLGTTSGIAVLYAGKLVEQLPRKIFVLREPIIMNDHAAIPNRPKETISRVVWRSLWIFILALMLLLSLIVYYGFQVRKRVLGELLQQIETAGRGSVSIDSEGSWKLLGYVGVKEECYFSKCFVGLAQANGEDGLFLESISDEALAVVTELEAVDTFYDGRGLDQIGRMRNLKIMNMNLSSGVDRVFGSLAGDNMPLLLEVYMQGNGDGVTDEGIAKSSIIQQLEILDLSYCEGITDESLPKLLEGSKLRFLSLAGTSITKAGYEKLQKRLGVNVVSWNPRF